MPQRRSLFPDAGSDEGFTQVKRSGESDLDITPMIDVTFLLLIFFMVTSTMQASPELDVPTAQYGVGVETQSASVILLKAPGGAGGDEPAIILGEDAAAGLNASLDEVGPFVEEGVREGRMQVIIKADREVPHGFVQQVTRIVAGVDGVKFYIGVRDKPGE